MMQSFLCTIISLVHLGFNHLLTSEDIGLSTVTILVQQNNEFGKSQRSDLKDNFEVFRRKQAIILITVLLLQH